MRRTGSVQILDWQYEFIQRAIPCIAPRNYLAKLHLLFLRKNSARRLISALRRMLPTARLNGYQANEIVMDAGRKTPRTAKRHRKMAGFR